jgi:endothelin-converting enzyme
LNRTAIPSLFEIFVEGDVKRNPHDLVAWLTQSGLGLPSKDYYDDKETLEVYEEIVRASLKSIYAAREEPTIDPKELAKEVLAFEAKLAKISIDPYVARRRTSPQG